MPVPVDEYGIPVQKQTSANQNVDEFGIPVYNKKKRGGNINGTDSNIGSQNNSTQVNGFDNIQKPTGIISNEQVNKANQQLVGNKDVHTNPNSNQYLQETDKAAKQAVEDRHTQAANNTTSLFFKNNPQLVPENESMMLKNADTKNRGYAFSLKNLPHTTAFQNKAAQIKSDLDSGKLTTYKTDEGELRAAYPMTGLKNTVANFKQVWNASGEANKILSMSDDDFKSYAASKPDNEYLPTKPDAESLSGQAGQGLPIAIKGGVGVWGGTVMSMAAPETLGLSTAGLPTIMAWAMTAPDMAKTQAAQAKVKAYRDAIQQGKSEDEALSIANNMATANYAEGMALGTALTALPSFISKGANEGFLKAFGNHLAMLPYAAGTQGLTAGGLTELKDEYAKHIGLNITDEQQRKDFESSFNGMIAPTIMFGVVHGLVDANGAAKAQAKNGISKIPPEQLHQMQDAMVNEGVLTQEQVDNANKSLQSYNNADKKIIPTGNEEKDGLIKGLVEKRDALKESKNNLDESYHPEIDTQIEDLNNRISLAKNSKDPIKYAEQDGLTGQPHFTPKEFEELTPKEKNNIDVPTDFGKASTKNKGEESIVPIVEVNNQPVKVEGTFTDKDKAQAAAEEKLKEIYYNNKLSPLQKPESNEKGKIRQEDTETSNTGDGLIGSGKTSIASESNDEGDVSGVKKAITQPLRSGLNLPKVELPKMGGDVGNLEQAKVRVDKGESNPLDLVDRILTDKNGFRNEDEVFDMQYYGHQLKQQEGNLKAKYAEAETETEKASVSGQIQQLSDEVDRFTEASQTALNKWGKIGNAAQVVVDEGFNPSREKLFIKDAYGGEIPKEVNVKIDAVTKERDAALTALKIVEEKLKKAEAEKALGKFKKSVGKNKEDIAKLKDEAEQLKQQLRQAFKKDLGNINSGIPIPKETLEVLGKLAINYLKQGALTVDAIVGKIYDDLKDEIKEPFTKKDVRDWLTNAANISQDVEAERLNRKARNIEDKVTPTILDKEGKPREQKPIIPQKSQIKAFQNSSEWVKANQRVINAEYKMKVLKRQAFESQKNIYQKGLMWLGRLTRLSVLSGYNVLYKLAAASTIGGALKRIPEQVIGGVYSKIFKGISEKAPIEGGLNAMSEVKFYKEFFNPKKFVHNTWEILKTGESDLSKKFSTGKYEHVKGLYLPTDLHQIIKDPLKRATFESSFRNALIHAEKNGLDINDPLIVNSIESAAFKRANYEIFQEQNALTRKFTAWKNQMEKSGNIGATGKFLADFLVPVSTVPTNIVRRLATTSPVGLIRGGIKVVEAYRKGIESLSNEQADAVMRQLKQGSFGTALWLLGWFGYSHFGGLYSKYDPDKKRKEGELASDEMEVNGEQIPKPVQHALPLEIIQWAATARRIYENYTEKKGENEFTSIYNAGLGSIGALIEQVPIIEETGHLIGAASEPYEANKLKEDVERRFEPQILRETGVIPKETKPVKTTGLGKVQKQVQQKQVQQKIAP